MNSIDKQYQALLQDILDNGVKKKDRTGTGTISVFGRQIRHKMSEGFPLLTTKKMYFKGVVTELLWFLRGDTNIKYLVDNDCHIWDGDAYKNYLYKANKDIYIEDPNDYKWDISSPKKPEISIFSKEEFINKIKTNDEFAKRWGELGPVYGKQWRSWDTRRLDKENEIEIRRKGLPWTMKQIDQIANLINDLKTNPDSRRLMVSAWNVGELDQMVLPPCHYGFQVYTRELSLFERAALFCTKTGQKDWKERVQATIEIQGEETLNKEFEKHNIPARSISLMFNMRSNDVPLGLPFNLSSYGLLLEIIGKIVNMIPDELICNLGDAHIYINQIEGVEEQLRRNPFKLPSLVHMKTDAFYNSLSQDLSLFSHLNPNDFKVEGYQHHPIIKIPLSN